MLTKGLFVAERGDILGVGVVIPAVKGVGCGFGVGFGSGVGCGEAGEETGEIGNFGRREGLCSVRHAERIEGVEGEVEGIVAGG